MAQERNPPDSKRSKRRERRTSERRDAVSVALKSCAAILAPAGRAPVRLKTAREAVVVFVAIARLHGTPPERMLAMLKRMLGRVPALRAMLPEDREEYTGRLIAAAIEQYYRERSR